MALNYSIQLSRQELRAVWRTRVEIEANLEMSEKLEPMRRRIHFYHDAATDRAARGG